MKRDSWERLTEIFEAAIERSGEDREQYLAGKCKDDPALLEEVRALLAKDSGTSTDTDFFGESAPHEALLGSGPRKLGRGSIDGYRILGVLGHGGMGTIFEAEQEQPRRIVALKTLKYGLHSSRTIRRFEYEAEVLAKLRHPGIAQVFDAGTFTDQGTGEDIPFFAMEYIDGARSITSYATEEKLSLEETLALFIRVCEASSHGHHQGFIHRDLKPANILVDRNGDPKIIDFGIARALDRGEDSDTEPTVTGNLLGTLSYISPEQLASDKRPVDNRADIYSLGVVLFELLTGRLPFDIEGKSITEAAQIIQNEEAPKASSMAVAGLESKRGHGHKLDWRKLDCRELDWIVWKALEKNPSRRYSSASDLAADLRHFLANEPVLARPPSLLYLGSKFASRHRGRLLAGSLALFLMAALLLIQGIRAGQARRQEARSSLESAKKKLDAYRKIRIDTASIEATVRNTYDLLQRRHLNDREHEILERESESVLAGSIDRERLFYEILDLLSAAEKGLGQDEEIHQTRLQLYFEKWQAARAQLELQFRDERSSLRAKETAAFYKKLIEGGAPSAELKRRLNPTTHMSFDLLSEDQEIHVFRMEDLDSFGQGGMARRVFVPVHADGKELRDLLGAEVLRITEAQPPLEEEDSIWSVEGMKIASSIFARSPKGEIARIEKPDGSAPKDAWELREWLKIPVNSWRLRDAAIQSTEIVLANAKGKKPFRIEDLPGYGFRRGEDLAEEGGRVARVYHGGGFREMTLPKGLLVRRTRRPLLPSSLSRVRGKQLEGIDAPGTEFLIFSKQRGRDSFRQYLQTMHGEAGRSSYSLPKNGTRPKGFRWISPTQDLRPLKAAEHPPFLLLDREVTCREYLTFLNDPQTLAEIQRSKAAIRFPRHPHNEARGGYWIHEPNGKYRVPQNWGLDWPISGVSYQDAEAYARWYTKKHEGDGRHLVYTPPSVREWDAASFTFSLYVFGDRFDPRWINSCFSRPRVSQEAVLSYPMDETPTGIYDMSGSVFEWLGGWFWKERNMRPLAAGSWAMSERDVFRTIRRRGNIETAAASTYGFRLVAKPR